MARRNRHHVPEDLESAYMEGTQGPQNDRPQQQQQQHWSMATSQQIPQSFYPASVPYSNNQQQQQQQAQSSNTNVNSAGSTMVTDPYSDAQYSASSHLQPRRSQTKLEDVPTSRSPFLHLEAHDEHKLRKCRQLRFLILILNSSNRRRLLPRPILQHRLYIHNTQHQTTCLPRLRITSIRRRTTCKCKSSESRVRHRWRRLTEASGLFLHRLLKHLHSIRRPILWIQPLLDRHILHIALRTIFLLILNRRCHYGRQCQHRILRSHNHGQQSHQIYPTSADDAGMAVESSPHKRRTPGFKRVRDSRDLRPYVNTQPGARRADPSGQFLSVCLFLSIQCANPA